MATSNDTNLLRHEIEEHVAFIAVAVNELALGGGDLERFGEVSERLQLLRALYKRQPEPLSSFITKLTELSRRFESLLDARMPEIVDRYHHVNEQLRRIEREKDYLREYLIRRAGPGPRETVPGVSAEVVVRSLPTRLLPPAGTVQRGKLERLLAQSGVWPEVSQLSRSKLQQALAKGRLSADDQRAIEELCPPTVVHQVTTRLRSG
jgi:hypothetical protein